MHSAPSRVIFWDSGTNGGMMREIVCVALVTGRHGESTRRMYTSETGDYSPSGNVGFGSSEVRQWTLCADDDVCIFN